MLDGEILGWRDGAPLPFGELQRRINRESVGRKLLEEVPTAFKDEWTWADLRKGAESMHPFDYFKYRYYEKWLGGISGFFVDKGYITAEELEANHRLMLSMEQDGRLDRPLEALPDALRIRAFREFRQKGLVLGSRMSQLPIAFASKPEILPSLAAVLGARQFQRPGVERHASFQLTFAQCVFCLAHQSQQIFVRAPCPAARCSHDPATRCSYGTLVRH